MCKFKVTKCTISQSSCIDLHGVTLATDQVTLNETHVLNMGPRYPIWCLIYKVHPNQYLRNPYRDIDPTPAAAAFTRILGLWDDMTGCECELWCLGTFTLLIIWVWMEPYIRKCIYVGVCVQ